MKNIAIIPARGGSKRIPRKNIKPFLGKPIISYSIEAALESKLFDEVMVSTDDEEIADVAIGCGAKVPFFRSTINANDHASTFSVIEEVLDTYDKKLGEHFENCCCIYPCAPFVTEKKLSQSYEKMLQCGFDTVFPVVAYSTPIQRAFAVRGEKISMFYQEHLNTRSQDLEKAYYDAGQFYWFKTDTILLQKRILTQNTGCIFLGQNEVQDIDNEEDWNIAEMKYVIIHKGNNH